MKQQVRLWRVIAGFERASSFDRRGSEAVIPRCPSVEYV
jgi:hypothetical protein